MKTTIHLKQTVYWTFCVLVDTWEEVLTRWSSGICTETSRTRAPGRQWVCTLPSANVARTCRTIESPMTTASRLVSQRGAKRFRDEVVDRGLDRVFRCCTQCPGFPGAGVKAIWDDRIPGARGLCRETHGVEVVGVLAACCILTPDLWASARDVSSVGLSRLGNFPCGYYGWLNSAICAAV